VDGERTENSAQRVGAFLTKLGYDLTPYGAGVSVGLDGYSDAETASYFALATLARDVKDAGDNIEKLAAFLPHATAMLKILKEYKDAGLIREALWKNDTTAIWHVANVDKEQLSWIERVLSDPVISNDRVAVSRIDYSEVIRSAERSSDASPPTVGDERNIYKMDKDKRITLDEINSVDDATWEKAHAQIMDDRRKRTTRIVISAIIAVLIIIAFQAIRVMIR
jgi:hypothetical protein